MPMLSGKRTGNRRKSRAKAPGLQRRALLFLLCLFILLQPLPAGAAQTGKERILLQQAMEIQSNQIPDWPQGPVVGAEAAILMDADTGAILYAKNIHQKEYPASTTKILTTLIATERCSLDEWVFFSHDAVFDTPYDSNHIAMDEGEALTMEDCLRAILIRSANEVSFAVAEHITGTCWEDFADIMNERAKELGCVDSHFVNPNGLPNEDHYTSAYDLAMIGRAFFDNELLCSITLTPTLHLYPTEYQPDEKIEANKMLLLPGREYAYEPIIGCKTGYTNDARNCLISCAEKDGMKLICAVFRDETPYHYTDTLALYEYGFQNFQKVNVSQMETKYEIDDTGLFYSDNDIFGSSRPLLSLNRESSILLPKTLRFSDLTSSLSYEDAGEGQAAVITYSYRDVFLGSASVDLAVDAGESYRFDTPGQSASPSPQAGPNVLSVNIPKAALFLCVFALGLGLLALLIFLIRRLASRREPKNNRRAWLKARRKGRGLHYYARTQEADSLKEHRRQAARARRRQRFRRRDRH